MPVIVVKRQLVVKGHLADCCLFWQVKVPLSDFFRVIEVRVFLCVCVCIFNSGHHTCCRPQVIGVSWRSSDVVLVIIRDVIVFG